MNTKLPEILKFVVGNRYAGDVPVAVADDSRDRLVSCTSPMVTKSILA